MKKILNVFLLVLVMFAMVSCKKDIELSTPTNVKISDVGLITWDTVENATSYIVVINNEEIPVTTPFYLVTNLNIDFTYSVIACKEGVENSAPSEELTYKTSYVAPPKPPKLDIAIGISGSSEVKSGKSIKLEANVTGTDNKEVTWEVTSGKEYASIDEKGA